MFNWFTRFVQNRKASSIRQGSQDTVQKAAPLNKYEDVKNVFNTEGADVEEQTDGLYREMLNKIAGLLEMDGISVLTLDPAKKEYVPRYSLANNGWPHAMAVNENSPILKELSEGQQFVIAPLPVKCVDTNFPLTSVLFCFFPVTVNKKIGAILSIHWPHVNERDAELISGFCREVALAIENTCIHRDLYTKLNRFAAISEVTNAITPIQDERELVRMILDKSAELLKAEQGSLMIYDRETNMLLLQAKKGAVEGITEDLRLNPGQTISGKVVKLGEPILVDNIENDPRTKQKNRHNYKTRSFISVPIKINDRIMGVLNLADKNDGEPFTDEDLKLTVAVATQAAVVMERNLFFNKNEELTKLSITDSLTGLVNRRYLNQRLQDEVERAKRHAHELSVIMLDLDGFKYCNDTHGHIAGDKALILVGETLLSSVRSIDVVARYGGDEFVVILPNTGESMAIHIAERVRRSLDKKVLLTGETGAPPETVRISASMGVVSFPQDGETSEVLLSNADKALYLAKSNGKNRIEVL